jgi:hypothetical protein
MKITGALYPAKRAGKPGGVLKEGSAGSILVSLKSKWYNVTVFTY